MWSAIDAGRRSVGHTGVGVTKVVERPEAIWSDSGERVMLGSRSCGDIPLIVAGHFDSEADFIA